MPMRVKPSSFLHLGKKIIGLRANRSEKIARRRFKAHFGATPEKCTTVWNLVCRSSSNNGLPFEQVAKPEHLLWGLMLMKMYATEITMAAKVGTDEKTFRKRAWQAIEAIASVSKYVILWDNRLRGNVNGRSHNVSIDGTDCLINEPRPFSGKWWSHKHNGPGLRYEVGLSIRNSEIVWIKGPFPCGSWPDITIFRMHLRQKFLPGEKCIADRGYRGEPDFVTTRNDCETRSKRRLLNRIRGRHENVNARLKNWNCVKDRFRHDLSKHGMVFKAVAVLTQLSLKTDEPLFPVFF